MSKNQESNIDNVIEKTFNHIKDIVDANTVVGKIIDLGNKLFIIPVSKISVGLISGGGTMPKGSKNNITAGSGTGFNIIPIGFITISNFEFKFLPVNSADNMSKNILDLAFKLYENYSNNYVQKENKNDEKN